MAAREIRTGNKCEGFVTFPSISVVDHENLFSIPPFVYGTICMLASTIDLCNAYFPWLPWVMPDSPTGLEIGQE